MGARHDCRVKRRSVEALALLGAPEERKLSPTIPPATAGAALGSTDLDPPALAQTRYHLRPPPGLTTDPYCFFTLQ